MTRVTIAVLVMAAASSLAGIPSHLAAQRCWYCHVEYVGEKERTWCMIPLGPGKDARVDCDEDRYKTYCSVDDYEKCGSMMSAMTISPDGSVLPEDDIERDALSPIHRVSSMGANSARPGLSHQVAEETAVAAEVQFVRGRWRVVACGDIVIGRRYSEDVVAGLMKSSSLISL